MPWTLQSNDFLDKMKDFTDSDGATYKNSNEIGYNSNGELVLVSIIVDTNLRRFQPYSVNK